MSSDCNSVPFRHNPNIEDASSGTSITGAASTIVSSDLVANRALVSNASGKVAVSSVTSTELGYVSGVTSAIQTQLDGKEPTLTKGNLTEATSSILTITGGTGAVIGSGLTIEVAAAASGTSGYLTGSDWDTFNGKLTSTLTDSYIFVGNASNVATGVAVSGDITMANDGTVAIASGAIVNADVNASAGITLTKLAPTTASRALVSDGTGYITAASVTATELGYVSGVTSAIQTQLDNRLTVSLTGVASGDIVYHNGTNWVNLGIGTSGQVLKTNSGATAPEWAAEVTPAGVPTGGSAAQYLEKIDATDYNTQWVTLTASKITDLTATASEINTLSGITATVTELNYTDGVTSNIQTQLDGKQDDITGAATTITTANLTASRALLSTVSGKVGVSTITSTELEYLNGVTANVQTQLDGKQTTTLTNNAILIGSGGVATELAAGTEGYVLTISSGTPAWVSNPALSNTAASNEIPKSNGTDFVPSGIYSSTDANLELGDVSTSGQRTITAKSSTTTSAIYLKGQGDTGIVVTNDSTSKNLLIAADASGDWQIAPFSNETSDLTIHPSDGSSGTVGGNLTLSGGDSGTAAAGNVTIVPGNSTGTKGVLYLQKPGATTVIEINTTGIGFFAATPVAQPSSTGETTGFTAGAGTGVNNDSTFTGNVGSTAYRVSDVVKHLKNLGLIAQ